MSDIYTLKALLIMLFVKYIIIIYINFYITLCYIKIYFTSFSTTIIHFKYTYI